MSFAVSLPAALLAVSALFSAPMSPDRIARGVIAPRDALAAGDGLPTATPESVGMSGDRLSAIDRIVQRGITAGGYPGASVVVGRKGFAVWSRGFGTLDWMPGSSYVQPAETLYDIASLTKVVATTTAIMILYDEGKIALDAPVSRYLPSFTGALRDSVTVTHLLTHRAGLPSGLPLWRLYRTVEDARAAVLAAPVVRAPGSRFEYSDLGPMLLAYVVEAAAGQPFDRFVQRRIFDPLGMTATTFRPSPRLALSIAPTEIAPPRGYPLRGEVHDENAYRLGGIAGHAGLFSTAADLSVFAQMMLRGGSYGDTRIVSDTTVARFTASLDGRRALGWDVCSTESPCGAHLTTRAFGHTGFTGTSLWIDPDHDLFVVMLSNRVHAPKARRPATIVRDVRNDIADAAVLAVMDDPVGVRTMPPLFRADKQSLWNTPVRPVRRPAARKAPVRSAAAKRTSASR